MIRMVQSKASAHAKSYYTDALAKSDYYMEDQELGGEFRGNFAARLGLSGKATKEQFFALCENRNPFTGKPLTPRTKAERTTGYDINFHCPKSVSILHVLSENDHVLQLFRASVQQTMQIIESDAQTRVRKKGAYANRVTGELLWADFVHQTARPVQGYAPDPHLHAHCYVFNMTYDPVEKRVKAGEFRDINRNMPMYQAIFHKVLADRLTEAGYRIRRTETSFEIEGIPQEAINLFSKRTNEIGQVAKEKGITDTKTLDSLGARTRSAKDKGLTMPELKAEWRRQIREAENKSDDIPRGDAPPKAINSPVVRHSMEALPETISTLTAQLCVDHALSHGFERASVMPYSKLLQLAVRHGTGTSQVSMTDIKDCLTNDPRLIKIQEKLRIVCTTKEVLAEEKLMVELARQGKGTMRPLFTEVPKLNAKGEAAEAITHILTTKDMVSIVRGAAGTGKTTLMKEAVEKIKMARKEVIAVAPTAQASRSQLRQEGFTEAETVARLLIDKSMQEKLKGQVLWVDEAGMLGTKDMAALLALAHQQKARLILGGDTRQHSSVVRGDALRILNTVGEIRTAEVSKIYRQKNEAYKAAIEDLSKGNIRDGFDKLDAIGFIREIDPMKPNEALVDDYVEALKNGKDTLIISPTHKQGAQITDAVRQRLKQTGHIGKKEIAVTTLNNLNLTEAEKNDWRNYRQGQMVHFNQNMKGFRRGSHWTVTDATEIGIVIKDNEGRTETLPDDRGNKIDVFRLQEIQLVRGDKIRITREGFDCNKRRLNNGQVFDVISVKKSGDIALRNKISKAEYAIDKNFGHLAHAHCVTSHFSQGKTVDEVFIAQPAVTFGATNAKQFYVSVSRARERARVYTDAKDILLAHASELGDRQSALELVSAKDRHRELMQLLQRNEINIDAPALSEGKTPEPKYPIIKYDDYEPTL